MNKTFILLGDAGLDYDQLRNILTKHNYQEIKFPCDINIVDYIHIEQDGSKNKDLYKINCTLKNILTNQKLVITDKEYLFNNIRREYPDLVKKHLPDTRNINDIKEIKPKEILIVKPVGPGAHSGIGIEIVTNMEELLLVKKKLESFKSIIVSTYINNPYLYNNKKFHIRRYWLVSTNHIHNMCEIGKIITAAEDYKQSDYSNKKIHDTHMKSTPRDLFYPEDLPKTINKDKIEKQMQYILDIIYKMFARNIKTFSETKYAYEVFGIDFMIDSNETVYLIEINSPFMNYSIETENGFTEKYKKFSKKYFEWLYKTIISKIID